MGSRELKPSTDLDEVESSQETLGNDSAGNLLGQELDFRAVKEAKDHIAWIRRSKGLDLPNGQESGANVEDLEKALDVLSDQLYSQPTHFLLEFIQNADDNSYDGVRPTISFTSANGHLCIDCNETGFEPANVEAICRIGKSTKKDRSKGFIGEKGIGFKSVFKIANTVWISSRAYTFKFDRSAQLGMIAPIWEGFPGHVKADASQFYLQLSQEKGSQDEKDLLKQLRFFDSTLLLFLRKLKKIDIFVDDVDWRKRFTNQITRIDTTAYGGELMSIKKKWAKTKKADETLQYLVVRHVVGNMPDEPKRRGMDCSEVVLGFPFIGDRPAFHLQKAYAFLPIKDSGFRFLLQGDFILIANREDIEKSNQWNDSLVTGLAECFIQAVVRFNSAEASVLRYTWLGFLHNVPKPGVNNFSGLADRIFYRLQFSPALESQNGVFVRPGGAFFIPRAFRDADERFILNCAGNCHRYISASYETHDKDHDVLKRMGVEIMTFAHFITIIKIYLVDHTEDFHDQRTEWQSLIAKILYEHASDTDLKTLAIIPLNTGRWISKLDGQAHFETPEAIAVGKIPEGVPELLIVDQAISREPQRRKLLERLEVKDLNRVEVCRLITNCYVSTIPPELTLDVFISHATYLFEATSAGGFSLKGKNFWVVDKDGRPRESAKMYLNNPNTAHSVGSLLDDPCWGSCLLHPAYLLAYKGKRLQNWIRWLETHLLIRSTIQIALRGELTPEFQYLKAQTPSPVVLEILMDSWMKDLNQLTSNVKQQLGAMNVVCENGQTMHLNKTCLPLPVLKDLAPWGISFVQLDSPRKPIWEKLREFGVVVEPNLTFYLQCLSLLQGKKVTKAQMTELYKRIDGHWIENPRQLDEHFSKFDSYAIYVPVRRQWVHRRACVWESAPGMAEEIVLADQYPELHSFFFHRLKIPSATISKVIDELRANTGHDSLDLQRRKVLIFTLSDFLRRSPKDYSKLEALKDVPVMPVADNKYGTSAVNIASLNKVWWYFADQNRYYKCFQNKIAFADFRVGDYARLEPLDQAMQWVWGGEHHGLSRLVREERDFGSRATVDPNGTNYLREKVTYFRRVARAAHSRRGRDLERKLQRLNLVTIYTSSDIIVRTSIVRGQVGNTTLYGEPIPGKLMLQETTTDIQIYVHPGSMKHGRIPPRDTSEELCRCCGIADERMKRLIVEILLEEDHKEIEDMLSKHKVGGFDPNDLEAVPLRITAQNRVSSSSHARGADSTDAGVHTAPGISKSLHSEKLQQNQTEMPPEPVVLGEVVNQSRPSKMPYQGYASSTSVPEMNAREQKQAARHAEIGASVRVGGRENVASQTHATTENTFPKNVKTSKVLKPLVRPARKSSPYRSEKFPATMTHRDQSREESIGIYGEQAVFNILKDIFGSAINESAWTSELRQHVEACKPWIPEDPTILYSDFTVRDENGTLIKWMIANKVKVPADWAPGDFLYHIEVKSTTKNVDDPFFMSQLQINKAKEVSGTTSKNPREAFVIFRVYDVESEEPGLEVYCDPWRMIENGRLHRETQEWRVIPA